MYVLFFFMSSNIFIKNFFIINISYFSTPQVFLPFCFCCSRVEKLFLLFCQNINDIFHRHLLGIISSVRTKEDFESKKQKRIESQIWDIQ